MKKITNLILVIMMLFFVSYASADDEIGYARCNLKVIKGSHITWVNWQASPTFIPVGTEIQVLNNGTNLVNKKTGLVYTLDKGADGDVFLEKFIVKKPVDIESLSQDVQSNIRNAVAKIGMTKEESYMAMGPPIKVSGGLATNNMTYEDIMKYDLWIYARRRFGKAIGVAFDPNTGQVNRTEGIWGK